MKLKKQKDGTVKIQSRFFLRLFVFILVLALILVLSYFGFVFYNQKIKNRSSVSLLYKLWNNVSGTESYEEVYKTASELLNTHYLNNTVLLFKGLSAFYLSVSSNVPSESQQYLDDSINSLRLALRSADESVVPQIKYVLGKAYFYKNNFASYNYYSDLVIKYLLEAKNLGYVADDIPEYLGLSYASLGMTDESIASFTDALVKRESDTLLMAIAEQYFKNEQYSASKQYLFRVNDKSSSDDIILRSHTLLGKIAIAEKDFETAEKEFTSVLEKNPNSADAYYGLGVVYEMQDDIAKARAEWRKALRIQFNHPGALKKIAESNK